jgi:uracil-DNA glycosylase family 4
LYAALHRYGFANQATSESRDDGLRLTGCYVTAVVRCAPPANRPRKEEQEACRLWLESELEALEQVRVVIVLGRIAWEGWLKAAGWWNRMSPRQRPAFRHGARHRMPDGSLLITSYHPSRQNTNTGRLTRGMWNRVFRDARTALESA